MKSDLYKLLNPNRVIEVVDVGANPIDGEPPYKGLLTSKMCRVTGFEPQEAAFAELQRVKGPNERYFPDIVGDGGTHELNICKAQGMTSLFVPDPKTLELFNMFPEWGTVVDTLPLKSRRLDDIEEIEYIDYLKIDVQGGELNAFQGGVEKLSRCVAIQTEVSFVALYKDQPVLGDIDLEMRRQGFIPHCLAELKRWSIAPTVLNNDPRQAGNQLLEADMVYVRDFSQPELMSEEQLKHLAIICHHCYRSVDLAARCIMLLERRGSLNKGSISHYLKSLSAQ